MDPAIDDVVPDAESIPVESSDEVHVEADTRDEMDEFVADPSVEHENDDTNHIDEGATDPDVNPGIEDNPTGDMDEEIEDILAVDQFDLDEAVIEETLGEIISKIEEAIEAQDAADGDGSNESSTVEATDDQDQEEGITAESDRVEPSGNDSVEKEPLEVVETEPVVNESLQNLRSLLHEAIEERNLLEQINQRLQRKAQRWRDERNIPFGFYDDDDTPVNTSEFYQQKLDEVSELYKSFRKKQDLYSSRIDRLNARLDEEDENATELKDSFKEFKREIAKAAVFTTSGKPIPLRKLNQLEKREDELDGIIEVLRLKNIHFRNQLSKIEQQSREKDQLSKGLHLIDFEQLKIENQTLNEKIEERNDDLHKLRKKITTTVQILSHTKEKIKFIEKDNEVISLELDEDEEQVQLLREQLNAVKKKRELLRNEAGVLKQKQGFVGSDNLVVDFESGKKNIADYQEAIEQLKSKHERLTAKVREAQALQAT